jgi:hypothetical protein
MGQILIFPNKRLSPVVARNGRKHRVSVEVLDKRRPRRTRWVVQFEIQEVAGFDAVTGFRDAAVAKGYRHQFDVTSTRAVHEFVAETADLVANGKLAVWIDGQRVRPRVARSA